MNESDPNFEPLCKLLSLKKHEVPPPGYFNKFSGQVIGRIRHEEKTRKSDGVFGVLFSEAPWLLKFIQVFEAKPAYAGAFASFLCLLLVGAIVYTNHSDVNVDPLSGTETAQAAPVSSRGGFLPASLLGQAVSQSDAISSTNPMLNFQAAGSSVDSPNALFQQVNFTH